MRPSPQGLSGAPYLVEEEGALVGYAEVSGGVVDGSGIGAFDMSEELAVDGALGNGAAVDGEVLLAAAGRGIVDDAGDNLLAHAALAEDEDADVGGCHLQRDVEDMVEGIAVAHDVIALLDGL